MSHLSHPLAGGLGGDGSTPVDVAQIAQRSLWGEEILFTDDLKLAPNGDYVLVTGMAAVRQAIRIRLITRAGDLPWAPDFGVGIEDYLGATNGAAALAELRGTIKAQLLTDPRLSSITTVDVQEKVINSRTALVVTVRGTAAGADIPAEPFVFVRGGG
jgi:phage baseplate assembly protein W